MHEAPGGDRRNDLVEHGRALAMMATAHRHLHDIGDVPDRPVGAGQFVDDLANAAFELTDIDLTPWILEPSATGSMRTGFARLCQAL